jgi:O-antigen ligase
MLALQSIKDLSLKANFMQKFFARLDELIQTTQENKLATWLERTIFLFLLLMVLSAPHSIAATQISWLTGMLWWIIRLFLKPRLTFFKTPLNLAFLAFFLWSLVSSIFSYAPDISLDKLRGVSLLLIFFFIVNNLRSKQAAFFLAFALIVSCLVNVGLTMVERVAGRGVEVAGLTAESPLIKNPFGENSTEKIRDGDTIVATGKKKISSPEELLQEIETQGVVKIRTYHNEFYWNTEVRRDDLLKGENALEKLGIGSWKKNHNWRAQGFFGHFTTYSEVLQLISALVFGLLLASLTKSTNRKMTVILAIVLGGMLLALLLTVTRASQGAFLVSSFVVTFIGASRKMFLVLLAIALPAALIGLYVLQKSRNVGFYDPKDGSITWRQTVYREGVDLATNSPRHLVVGVGMDSIKRYAQDWHLFDDGRLPMGHFHSTPLQLAVERGLPALLIWLWILWLYGSSIWRKLKTDEITDWREKGILLGGLGSLVGFFVSGIVHYNLGDGEVAMVFYILMGLSIFLTKSQK